VKLTLWVLSQQARGMGERAVHVFDGGGTIGRSPSNDFMLPDPMAFVSHCHVTLSRRDDGWYLRSRGVNGAVLNRQTVPRDEWINLQSGDRLWIGEYELAVSTEDTLRKSLTSQVGHLEVDYATAAHRPPAFEDCWPQRAALSKEAVSLFGRGVPLDAWRPYDGRIEGRVWSYLEERVEVSYCRHRDGAAHAAGNTLDADRYCVAMPRSPLYDVEVLLGDRWVRATPSRNGVLRTQEGKLVYRLAGKSRPVRPLLFRWPEKNWTEMEWCSFDAEGAKVRRGDFVMNGAGGESEIECVYPDGGVALSTGDELAAGTFTRMPKLVRLRARSG
jgi:hypothetical protein